MRAKIILSILVLCGLQSCKKEESSNVSVAETNSVENVDNSSLVSEINQLKNKIEADKSKLKKVEISTKDLRSQIKQKWSKIHFYLEGDNVVRIKTYPYEQISERTEEFYFNNSKLIFAIIKDDGNKNQGEDEKTKSKMYYFNDGKLVKEINNSEEEEHEIRRSDSERLLQEADEYLLLVKK